MKKLYLLVFTLLSLPVVTMQAQVVDENETHDDETEITVTNAKGKKEVIDLPEAMTMQLDSLMHLYNTKTYLRPDTTCNLPDINPVYDASVYKLRLSKLPTIIEMPYNDVVQKFIDLYSGQLRRSVSYMLGAQNFYMPIFEEALEAYGLPLELKYLPVIESALNPRAVSRVGATGLWQFMLNTGKRYGLTVNSLVDDRRDPVKSSYAAAHYLSDLYKIYGDWNLVIAAYNCGPEKINQAIHRSKQNDYWQIYPYLPRETRGYVPAFIAANYIMNYYCEHNICPMTTDLPMKTDTVVVNRDLHFEQVAHVLGLDVDQIAALNPQYRHNIINGNWRPSTLRLPATMVTKFIDNEEAIYKYMPEDLTSKRTEVEVNDEEPTFVSYRRAHRSHASSSKYSNKKGKKKKGRKEKSKSITIREGDTLSEIAKRNKVSVKQLRRLNGIKGSNIRAGKKIKIK
ncbi:lytic transglycosylase domain-containing protein [Segatella oulorum]|uniref:lytic transglycosylase domain-containing protein n=1 Tax=Segatella oulorum TaxID=28136 RepID=UPI0023F47ABE|nr:lytic transglycosylase domain-containing protein [Segatella oulorum]